MPLNGPLGKCEAVHPQSPWVCRNDFFMIDSCMLSTNLKVLSGADEEFSRYDAFFLPLILWKLNSFRGWGAR